MFKNISHLIIFILLLLCGFFTYCKYFYERPEEKEFIDKKIKLFLDYEKIASATSKIVLPNRVSDLVKIKNDIDNMTVSYVCQKVKANTLANMDTVINTYNLFLAGADNIDMFSEKTSIIQLESIMSLDTCRKYNDILKKQQKEKQEKNKQAEKIIKTYINNLKNKDAFENNDFEIQETDLQLIKNNIPFATEFLNDIYELKNIYQQHTANNNVVFGNEEICTEKNKRILSNLVAEANTLLTQSTIVAIPFSKIIKDIQNKIDVKFSRLIDNYDGYEAEYIITNNSPYTIAALGIKNNQCKKFIYYEDFGFYRQNADKEEFSGLPPHSSVKVISKVKGVSEAELAGDKLREYREIKKGTNTLVKKKKDKYFDTFVIFKNVIPYKVDFTNDISETSSAPISKKINYTKCEDVYYSLGEEYFKERSANGDLTCLNVMNKNRTIYFENYNCGTLDTMCNNSIFTDYSKNQDIFGSDFVKKELENNKAFTTLKENIKQYYSKFFNVLQKDLSDNIDFTISDEFKVYLGDEKVDIMNKYNQICYKQVIRKTVDEFIFKYKRRL